MRAERESTISLRDPVYAAGVTSSALAGLSIGAAFVSASVGEFHQVGEFLNLAVRFGSAAHRLYEQTIQLQLDRQFDRAMQSVHRRESIV